ncbi:hypothetical protein LH464_04140 [Neorhizobium sp. T786]|uniref:hypothetical protein n=1 Tax=Pseudorhizobium xiangyangii TaxID=2883104 RepID=UPI001CFF7742|nr:hypothetical protein [Neorhizobium xiangyangii]MCB5201667.1 hypothetical protein [Neorhizobium xiangyangii]
MKPGDVLFEVWAEDGNGKIAWSEWVVRSIRKGTVYATLKASWTWGKKSKKHGDFGWLDPIGPEWRVSWPVDGEPRGQLATTRLTAIKKAIALQKRYGSPDDYAEAETHASIIKRLETMLTKERGKKARAKAKSKPPEDVHT